MADTRDSRISPNKAMETEIEVPLLIEPTKSESTNPADNDLHGLQVGVVPYVVDDPTDPDYVFLVPKIFVNNKKKFTEPRHIYLVIDTSSSMNGIGIESIKNTLKQFFSELKDDDVITIKTFSNEVKTIVSQKSKKDLNTFNEIISNLTTQVGTALNDAISSIEEDKEKIISCISICKLEQSLKFILEFQIIRLKILKRLFG